MTQPVSPTVRRQQMINKLGHLTAGDLFGYYTRGEPEWIAKIGAPAALEAGNSLEASELQDQLLWLKQGRIQVSRLGAEGNKTAIITLEPGSVFGLSLIHI